MIFNMLIRQAVGSISRAEGGPRANNWIILVARRYVCHLRLHSHTHTLNMTDYPPEGRERWCRLFETAGSGRLLHKFAENLQVLLSQKCFHVRKHTAKQDETYHSRHHNHNHNHLYIEEDQALRGFRISVPFLLCSGNVASSSWSVA